MKKIIITVLVALMLTTAAFAASEVNVTEAGKGRQEITFATNWRTI